MPSVAHYAVYGHTAAELIVERADATKEHKGLTTWQDAGKITVEEAKLHAETEFEKVYVSKAAGVRRLLVA